MRTIIMGLCVSAAWLTLAAPSAAQDEAARPTVRVFVAETQAQAFSGGGGGTSGGSNDQTVEIQKNLQEQEECQGLRVTNRAPRAHFVVTMDRSEGGVSKRLFGFASRDNKIALFDGWGDLIYSNSTRSLGNAVKDVCTALWAEIERGAELITVADADDQ